MGASKREPGMDEMSYNAADERRLFHHGQMTEAFLLLRRNGDRFVGPWKMCKYFVGLWGISILYYQFHFSVVVQCGRRAKIYLEMRTFNSPHSCRLSNKSRPPALLRSAQERKLHLGKNWGIYWHSHPLPLKSDCSKLAHFKIF